MNKRTIGTSELQTAPLAFGGNVFGWTVDQPKAFELLDAFAGAGFNLIDTADAYSAWVPGNSGGESETIIGHWLKKRGRRDDVLIATKVGWDLGPGKKGLSKAYIIQAVESSLRRLQTDYIDLYQSHLDDQDTPLEETLEAFGQLVAEGKVRIIGASNYTAERLTAARDIGRRLGLPLYECLQPHYNLVVRSKYEGALEAACISENVGVIPYSSLASGFLTGKYRSKDDLGKSPRGARIEHWMDERSLRILSALDKVAAEYKTSLTRVALAWLLTRQSITAPIVSATDLTQLDDILGAVELELDPVSVDLLNDAGSE